MIFQSFKPSSRDPKCVVVEKQLEQDNRSLQIKDNRFLMQNGECNYVLRNHLGFL